MFPFLCPNTRVVKLRLFQKMPMELTGGDDDQIYCASPWRVGFYSSSHPTHQLLGLVYVVYFYITSLPKFTCTRCLCKSENKVLFKI